MFIRKFILFLLSLLFCKVKLAEEDIVEIEGIEPIAGPLYGETRVVVRIKNFKESYNETYKHPKVGIP